MIKNTQNIQNIHMWKLITIGLLSCANTSLGTPGDNKESVSYERKVEIVYGLSSDAIETHTMCFTQEQIHSLDNAICSKSLEEKFNCELNTLEKNVHFSFSDAKITYKSDGTILIPAVLIQKKFHILKKCGYYFISFPGVLTGDEDGVNVYVMARGGKIREGFYRDLPEFKENLSSDIFRGDPALVFIGSLDQINGIKFDPMRIPRVPGQTILFEVKDYNYLEELHEILLFSKSLAEQNGTSTIDELKFLYALMEAREPTYSSLYCNQSSLIRHDGQNYSLNLLNSKNILMISFNFKDQSEERSEESKPWYESQYEQVASITDIGRVSYSYNFPEKDLLLRSITFDSKTYQAPNPIFIRREVAREAELIIGGKYVYKEIEMKTKDKEIEIQEPRSIKFYKSIAEELETGIEIWLALEGKIGPKQQAQLDEQKRFIEANRDYRFNGRGCSLGELEGEGLFF